MTYKKPEINVLGDAAQVIQFIVGKPVDSPLEPMPPFSENPAYDLDE